MTADLSEIMAIIVDIDGTITDAKGFIDVKAIEVLRRIERTGVMVCFASGNALPVSKALASYIGITGPVIAETGCVVDVLNGVRIYGDPKLPREALAKLKKLYGTRVKESWSNPYRHVDIAIRPTIPKDYVVKVVEKYEELTVLDSKFAYHIHPKNIDKGFALEIACDIINLPLEYVAAVGDSELDKPMIEKAGYAVSVQNSPDDLKKISDYVTQKKYADGFIEFANKLIKKKVLK